MRCSFLILLAFSLIGCGLGANDPEQMRAAFNRRVAAKTLEDGTAYLKKNAEQPGVTVLKSGVQYKVLRAGPGQGDSPKNSNYVIVHYRGKLTNGDEFDNSFARKKPGRFRVNKVVPGWAEVLQLMRPGDHWQVFIPASAGYGDQEQLGIPPNSVLIFEVELISVE